MQKNISFYHKKRLVVNKMSVFLTFFPKKTIKNFEVLSVLSIFAKNYNCFLIYYRDSRHE